MSKMVLYFLPNSPASTTVEICLRLKGLDYELRHPSESGSEDGTDVPDFIIENYHHIAPVLFHGQRFFIEPLAIADYLDRVEPDTQLLPADSRDRGKIMAITQIINNDIQALNSRRVCDYLTIALKQHEMTCVAWFNQWFREGFTLIESLLDHNLTTGQFCYGMTPCIADACLVPQIWMAQRNKLDLSDYPHMMSVYHACMELDVFQVAHSHYK